MTLQLLTCDFKHKNVSLNEFWKLMFSAAAAGVVVVVVVVVAKIHAAHFTGQYAEYASTLHTAFLADCAEIL